MEWRTGLVVLFLLCNNAQEGTSALSKAALQQTKNLMKNLCKRNSGVSQDVLNEFKNGNIMEDPKLKCYIHCCLGMMKTMKKDKITPLEATKQIEALLPQDMKEASLKQLNSCKDAQGANACDVAFNFVKCCLKVDPSNILIPL